MMKQVTTYPYIFRRIVRYSDCDASRNYYTPRAIDYAIEAVESWHEMVLGASWSDLRRSSELEVLILQARCAFRKTLTAGEVVLAQVVIEGVENSRILFTVSASNAAGELCFQAGLTACFVECGQFEPRPVPSEYRQTIESYRACCKESAVIGNDLSRGEKFAQVLPLPLTASGSDVPFHQQRRVVYGDCAPSGLIYPPRVIDYILEAVGEWYEKYLGISWLEQNSRKIGQPFLNVSCDYLKPMAPGQTISSAVTVCRLGRSSIVYAVTGWDEKGAHCFDAQLTACYSVEDAGALKATPFPELLRERIMAYQTLCADWRL